MIALDTNVVVRVLTRDDPEQVSAALEVMRSPEIWLSKTVLLETEWVLRFSYKLGSEAIQRSLRKLVGLPNLGVEDPQAVLGALEDLAGGMDFADALHLRSSTRATHFATFDRKLARRVPAEVPEILLLG